MLTICNLKNNGILELRWFIDFLQLNFLIWHFNPKLYLEAELRTQVSPVCFPWHHISCNSISYYWTNSNVIWGSKGKSTLSVKGVYVSNSTLLVMRWGSCNYFIVSYICGSAILYFSLAVSAYLEHSCRV